MIRTLALAMLLLAWPPALRAQEAPSRCDPAPAQDDCSAVLQATDALFAAMQSKDTATLRLLIHPRAQIVSVSNDAVSVRTLDEWIRGLARTPDVLAERMWDPQVRIDRNLATLWAPYEFYLGDRFSHCGYDAFQFVREGGEWRMMTIAFTRRTDGCERAP